MMQSTPTSLLDMRVSAWLATSPDLASEPHLIVRLVQDLVEALQPHQIDAVHSTEPRVYRLTEAGLNAMTDALSDRRVGSLYLFSSTGHRPGESGVSVAIHLATSRNDADHALSLEFIATIVPGQSKSPVLHQLAGIMRHWAAEVGITAAFVSEDPRDDGSRTYHERSNNLPALVTWDAVQEHVRGVFWGMALGSALCDRLGGQGAVLASAPSVIREPLGGGVWLQLTPDPPAPPQSYRQMREYLSSLLTWPAPPRPHPSLTEPVVPTVSLPPSDGPAVPIQWLDTDEGDAAINVYLSPPLTDAAEMAIVSAVNSWYDAGFYGAFGDAGFHWLNEPSVDHSSAVIRWMLDPGSANITMAMEVLARWLAAIPNNPVRELVVGTEVVG